MEASSACSAACFRSSSAACSAAARCAERRAAARAARILSLACCATASCLADRCAARAAIADFCGDAWRAVAARAIVTRRSNSSVGAVASAAICLCFDGACAALVAAGSAVSRVFCSFPLDVA